MWWGKVRDGVSGVVAGTLMLVRSLHFVLVFGVDSCTW